MSRVVLAAVAILCLTPTVNRVFAEIVGSKTGKVYHTHPESCPAGKKIAKDSLVKFPTIDDAKKAGRRQCRTCAKMDSGKPVVGGGAASTSHPAKGRPVRVAKILPGGTLQLADGQNLAIEGICIPSIRQPLQEEAQKLIEQETKPKVLLCADESQEPQHDALGRIRGTVLCHDGKKDLAVELLSQGLAWVDRDATCTNKAAYLKAEDEAWWAKRGIWQPALGEAGLTKVVVGKRTWQYHSPQCSHVRALTDPTTITVNEAKARRLAPCPNFRIKKAD